ncbi:hypothetical protein Trydic_g9256 [Trypoxylus dichotomus]
MVRHSDLNEKALRKRLESEGADFQSIVDSHHRHKHYEYKIVKSLKRMGLDVRVVNRLNYNDDCVKWADIVIPTGGDGTFLLAASRIRDNVTPIIGFNSDPNRSEGYLCLPRYYSHFIDEAIHRLLNGQFEWLLRNRIRATAIGEKGGFTPHDLHNLPSSNDTKRGVIKSKGRILPYLALNEVFIGETVSAKVSHLDISLNDELQETSVKCSGLCVSTGTGSTSWHSSINRLSVQTVAELLRLLDMSPTEDENSLATVLADLYNKQLLFDPTYKGMCYTIRDLISAAVWPKPKGIKQRDFATRVKVKSRCYNASLVIDGGVSFTFNTCSTILLECHPEDQLRTIRFCD